MSNMPTRPEEWKQGNMNIEHVEIGDENNYFNLSKAWFSSFLSIFNIVLSVHLQFCQIMISVCFSDVLVSCDTIMNITGWGGAPGAGAWSEAASAGARAGPGVILSSDGAENSDWPGAPGCQLSGSVPSVVSSVPCPVSSVGVSEETMGTMRHCGLLLLGRLSIARKS